MAGEAMRSPPATILRALELGIDFLDTADAYGIGHNEQPIRKTIAGRRDEIFLATKLTYMRRADDPTSWMISGRPEYVQLACDASLRRLGVAADRLSHSIQINRLE
jgi:aryl-alcohol dehydrogenase-like predicted oxidoreductase